MTSKKNEDGLTAFGFRFGANGPHAARTMMLEDLRVLLSHTDERAHRADYVQAIVVDNVLRKPSKSARQLSCTHMVALYALDPAVTLFRVLRRLWQLNEAAQPVLALAVALARDPLLRSTQHFFLQRSVGSHVSRTEVEALLEESHPHRFSAASLKSFAQNVAGTWTSAGILTGRNRKLRTLPCRTVEAVTFLLFLAYLEGRSGRRLFSSNWLRLLEASESELESLAGAAGARGLLTFMQAGGVVEVRFPGFLTPEEEQLRAEVAHVV